MTSPQHTPREFGHERLSPAPPPSRPTVESGTASPVSVRDRDAARRRWLLIGLSLPLAAVNIVGVSYYAAANAGRVRHPWHALLRPSGSVGQSAGVVAFVIFVFLWLYPLRKKYRRLAFTGSVGRWLDVHVASALLLPLLLVTHAAWRSDGVIGLGLVAMFVVIASGIVGRYLYTRIPRARSGVELSRDDVAAARHDLLSRLAESTGLTEDGLESMLATAGDAESRGLVPALRNMVMNDLTRARRCRELRRRWATINGTSGRSLTGRALDEAVMLADREIALDQQMRMLDATHRVFRFWHVAHRPFAITALVAVTVHIVVVVSLGATWFW